MFQKAKFFNDKSIMKMLENRDLAPIEAKNLGRKVAWFDEKAWDCVRYGMMVYVNYLKYSQNESLRNNLLHTKDLILVEASPVDLIWGIGFSEKDNEAIISDERNWRGQNLLGKALMEVRHKLK